MATSVTEQAYEARGRFLKAAIAERDRLDAVATERWHELKAAEKLIRQLEKALKGLHYVVVSDPKGVPSHLRKDLREAERVLEIVAARKRERRS